MKILLRSSLIAMAALFAAASFVQSSPPVTLTKLSGFTPDGSPRDSAYDPASQRMFVATDGGLEVFDLSDPSTPTPIQVVNPQTNGAPTDNLEDVALFDGTVNKKIRAINTANSLQDTIRTKVKFQ